MNAYSRIPERGKTKTFNKIKNFINRKTLSKIDTKTRISSLKKLGFKKIGKGKQKIVIKKEALRHATSEAKKVYYVPVANFFSQTEKALKKEAQKMAEIGKNLPSDSRLALARESTEEEKIEGYYTLVTEEAKGDFKKAIQDKNVNIDARIEYGRDLLQGFKELHETGYAYGDIKPENCLIFEDGLKIADFGKAQKIQEGKVLPHRGNLRFCPPEGTMSKKGDVYGAALTLIRNFEELLLDDKKTSLIEVAPENIDKKATTKDQEGKRQAPKKMRGIEKFVIEHRDFLGIKTKSFRAALYIRLPRQAKVDRLSPERKKSQEIWIELYINELSHQLVEQNHLSANQANKLSNLLKEMTQADPTHRPSMEEALSFYKSLFH